ncbi:phosphofurin acidic cluster sorting protein 1 [Anthonomus grandis grandis]|uniref:phosphofurin acidic cluster sorting protein 1 n=1 Tax=Anthonomus grandis grandis TaxID=2921223 RepID=UPI002165F7FF|nr:phosphofurin acidic cluster sorting protein 1 [Anthonomus grandis grandis]
MSEKTGKTLVGAGGTSIPNKMRLYATWVDRTPPNCIPRLCTLTFTRLHILRPLGSDLASVSIAVKMQSSKRTLRSQELLVPPNGLLDTPLDITFSVQYPHFLKREGNKLHILLQRRKRYKNRTMLGFKTLAEGVIRMDQVLQRPLDIELDLTTEGGGKDKVSGLVARLYILQVSSNPVDQQEHKPDREHDFSDEDDDISSGEEEVGDLSDCEPIRTKMPHTRHNLKQRFVALLKRFKVPDAEGGRGPDLDNPSDIQALFHELESLSCDEDSGAEQDTMSISSTPKPSLRPFFSSSRSLLESNAVPYIEAEPIGDEKTASGSDGNTDLLTDPEAQSDPQTGSPPREHYSSKKHGNDNDLTVMFQDLSEKKSKLFRTSASGVKKKNSLSVSSDTPTLEVTVRKGFLDQISRLLPTEENSLPECITLISGPENVASAISNKLGSVQPNFRVFQPTSHMEVKAVLVALFSKIQKYCNSCAKPSTPIKLLLVGGDSLVGWFVRPFVESLSSKPPEWLSFISVFIAPLGGCGVCRHLAALDPAYFSLFPNEIDTKPDEIAQRLIRYTSASPAAPAAHLPIGEAMLTCYDETSQLFIPFIHEVRVGPAEQTISTSVDMDEVCLSPPSAPSLTPPSSPNVQIRESPWEPLELQIDYWQMPKCNDNIIKTDKDKPKQDGKISLKGVFRGLQATPSNVSGLCVNIYITSKEKKQKIMRLGKKKEKEREPEPRCQNVEGVSRLICSARASHTTPMRVTIDGVEFNGVKFFQLSSTWQTHVKQLTVSLIGIPLASTEIN